MFSRAESASIVRGAFFFMGLTTSSACVTVGPAPQSPQSLPRDVPLLENLINSKISFKRRFESRDSDSFIFQLQAATCILQTAESEEGTTKRSVGSAWAIEEASFAGNTIRLSLKSHDVSGLALCYCFFNEVLNSEREAVKRLETVAKIN